ncbi:MAG: YicC family protein [Lachnospiraceae bacterium]|nr:YicC family protein [Lachnospiraceae bacterium]
MIKSMTGFGHCEKATEEYKAVVEIKSVNHKYCDISIKLPKKLNQFEVAIRNILKEYIKRGKVDVYISYDNIKTGNVRVKYNRELAKSYADSIEAIGRDFGIDSEYSAALLSRYPEVLMLEECADDETQIFDRVEKVLRGACEDFVGSRMYEGGNLKKDLLEKLDFISGTVDYIVGRSPEVVKEYRARLKSKVEELLGGVQVDESILATEVTVYADKMCVDEEMVRLKSHIANMKKALEDDESIGRKLDFIAQELNREANTTLSKSSDVSISEKAIELKTEIEKIREQIQNIE